MADQKVRVLRLLPAVSAALGSLDYTGFAGTCSNTGFSTTANGNASFRGLFLSPVPRS